ncbi:MAG: hypothetical protein JNL47_08075 [Bacteroidia bacterium]|nr:hypothetical protein [Bacteroidia bacterium]
MWNSGTLKPAYSGQPPHGSIPRAGIELNNTAGMVIGNYSNNKNQFNRMHSGVVGWGSVFRVINSEFTNMNKDTVYNPTLAGTAVISYTAPGTTHADFKFHSVSGGGYTVNSCIRGVYTELSGALISDIRMTGVEVGVYSTKCGNQLTTLVTGCEIYATKYGVHFYMNNGMQWMRAMNNRIFVSAKKSIGIAMEEGAGTQNSYMVNCNVIENADGHAGIYAVNLNRPFITQNTIRITSPNNLLNMHGIYFGNCSRATVGWNYVTGNTVTDSSKWGITSLFNTNSDITCNTTDSLGYGFYFGSINPNTQFKDNKIYHHHEGLHLNSSAVIGVQFHHGNKWYGNYTSGYGAVNLDTVFGGFALILSELDVHQMIGLLFHPVVPWFNTQAGGYQDWLVYDPSGTPYSCGNLIACNQYLIGGDDENENKSFELTVADDSFETAEYKTETKNIAKHYLYSELNVDSALLNSNGQFEAYFLNNANTNLEAFNTAMVSLNKAVDYDVSTKWQLSELDSIMQMKTDSLFVIESMYQATNNSVYANLKHSLTERLKELSDLKNISIGAYQATADSLLFSVQQTMTDITPAELPEENQKIINEIAALFYENKKDAINSYYYQLLAVAEQCPYAGGNAVLQARVIIKLLNDSIEYDDWGTCLQAGYYRLNNFNASAFKLKGAVQIIPNPAKNEVTIKLQNNNDGICRVIISDLLSNEVKNIMMNCTEKKVQISLENLPSSVYILKVFRSSLSIETLKLVVIK